MRTLSSLCVLALLAACSKPEAQPAQDTTAAAAPAPAALALADVAGKWSMSTMSATSDSVLVTYELTVPADGSAPTLTFPGRPPIAATQTFSGDSIITAVGPYESALRKSVQVTTNSVLRLQGSELVGTGVAHYSVSGPDSVLQLRMRGSRAP